jgi:hypothetical protein
MTGLGDMEKWQLLTLPGLEIRPLGRPARDQSHCATASVYYVYMTIKIKILWVWLPVVSGQYSRYTVHRDVSVCVTVAL